MHFFLFLSLFFSLVMYAVVAEKYRETEKEEKKT